MLEKTKNFVKDHKKEIVVGAIGFATGGIVYAIGGKYITLPKPGRVTMPGFTIEGPLTIADIGKLGDEYIKHDPVLTKETEILKIGSFVFE